MNKILILETKRCDTRALPKGEKLKEEDVRIDTKRHIYAVIEAYKALTEHGVEQAKKHDHTKLEDLKGFTDALNTRAVGAEFKKHPWWKKHMTERHHLNDSVPDDVNLLDVLEMVCDCVCAGMARTGEVYPVEIKPEVLKKAVANTAELLKKNIKVAKRKEGTGR